MDEEVTDLSGDLRRERALDACDTYDVLGVCSWSTNSVINIQTIRVTMTVSSPVTINSTVSRLTIRSDN